MSFSKGDMHRQGESEKAVLRRPGLVSSHIVACPSLAYPTRTLERKDKLR